jgi:hypothetical protein
MNSKEIIKKLFSIAKKQQKVISQLAESQPELTKQAGTGETVFIILYMQGSSAPMVQGVFSTQKAADDYMAWLSKDSPMVAQRLLVQGHVIDKPRPIQ